jgi:hypothetical protein
MMEGERSSSCSHTTSPTGRQAGEGTKLTPSEEQALIGAVIDYDH